MPKKSPTKKTTFGADLIDAMKDVLAHERGEIELEQVWPKPIDVKAVRTILKMRKMDASEREEAETVLDTYLHALGMQPDLFDDGETA